MKTSCIIWLQMSMKSKLRKSTFVLMLSLLLTCAVVILTEARFKFLRRGYDHFVLDNRNHYLSCEDLPTRIEVERIVEQQRDLLQRIHQVAPGSVGVEIDSSTCEGKADLLIWYGTHQQRIAIDKVIGGDTFFGIPYRL